MFDIYVTLQTAEQERTPHEKGILIDQMGHASSSSIVELDEKTKPTINRRWILCVYAALYFPFLLRIFL